MNAKNIMLGAFVALTIAFASLTAGEYFLINSLNSQIQSAQSTTSSSICTATGGIGCPHFFNTNYSISVNYAGPWGLSYQGHLGDSESGQLVVSGKFYGHNAADESVTVKGTNEVGTLLCAEAQKLDASSSSLVLRIASAMNQTSLAYGTTKICVAVVVV